MMAFWMVKHGVKGAGNGQCKQAGTIHYLVLGSKRRQVIHEALSRLWIGISLLMGYELGHSMY